VLCCSAVCYFAGRDIFLRLNRAVPIGLIESCFSGTRIETWMSPEALAHCPPSITAASDTELQQTASPLIPIPSNASVLWNGMWSGIQSFALKGVLWYQGESNAGSPTQYECLSRAFVLDLRRRYANYQLSFHFVLLAGFAPHQPSGWPEMRRSQQTLLLLPYTGLGSAVDLGDNSSPCGSVHPRYKQEVGERLSRSVMATVYGQNVVADGPTVAKVSWPDAEAQAAVVTIILQFDSSLLYNQGMYLNGTKQCDDCCSNGSAFAVLTSDGRVRDANVTHVYAAAYVVLIMVELPAGLRVSGLEYDWAGYPQCTLYNSEMLPMLPFQRMRD
jgi:sialate O-acetylesterase